MKGLISETRIHNKNDKPVTYSRSMVRDNEKNRRIEAMRNFDIAYSFVRENDSTFASKKMPCNGSRHFAPISNFSVTKLREARFQRREAGRKCCSWKTFVLAAALRIFAQSANLCSSNMDVFWTYSSFSFFFFLSVERYFDYDRIDWLIWSLRMWLLE